ncbi:MAG: fluoride efflux transporter CrcB [Bacteroidetes bacterium]|nr:MAG: fluoride efflux transporter CrcB [Bacteroidota bacterium]
MNEWLAVFLGGGAGSLVRYGIARWVGPTPSGFPTATLLANLLACVVMGLAIHLFSRTLQLPESYRLMILVGFCGGFSTFSSFSLDTLTLLQKGEGLLAGLYVSLSVLACLFILWLFARISV